MSILLCILVVVAFLHWIQEVKGEKSIIKENAQEVKIQQQQILRNNHSAVDRENLVHSNAGYKNLTIESRNETLELIRHHKRVQYFVDLMKDVKYFHKNDKPEKCQVMDNRGHLRQYRVLMFVDSPFFHLFENWLFYYENICGITGYQNLEVICMDSEVDIKLRNMTLYKDKQERKHKKNTHNTLPCSPSSFHFNASHSMNRNGMIWLKRMETIMFLLRQKYDVFLCDSDALWLRNPFPEISQHIANNSHIIASRGFFPFTISNKYGSTICMGLVYIRSTAFSSFVFQLVLEDMQRAQARYERFLSNPHEPFPAALLEGYTESEELLKQGNLSPDDQFSMNRIVFNAKHYFNVTWPQNMRRETLVNNTATHTGIVTEFEQERNIGITLLPQSKFIRNCLNLSPQVLTRDWFRFSVSGHRSFARGSKEAIIVHCIVATGDHELKETFAQFLGLWRLPHNITDTAEKIILVMKQKFTARIKQLKKTGLDANKEKALNELKVIAVG